MDSVKLKAMADLCDELTTSGEPQLDQRKLKELKKICRWVLTDLRRKEAFSQPGSSCCNVVVVFRLFRKIMRWFLGVNPVIEKCSKDIASSNLLAPINTKKSQNERRCLGFFSNNDHSKNVSNYLTNYFGVSKYREVIIYYNRETTNALYGICYYMCLWLQDIRRLCESVLWVTVVTAEERTRWNTSLNFPNNWWVV